MEGIEGIESPPDRRRSAETANAPTPTIIFTTSSVSPVIAKASASASAPIAPESTIGIIGFASASLIDPLSDCQCIYYLPLMKGIGFEEREVIEKKTSIMNCIMARTSRT